MEGGGEGVGGRGKGDTKRRGKRKEEEGRWVTAREGEYKE